jgi:hypothetical protein
MASCSHTCAATQAPSPALRESEHHRDLYKNYDELKDRIGFVPQQAVAGIPRRAGRATRPP